MWKDSGKSYYTECLKISDKFFAQEQNELNWEEKFLYHFTIVAMVNELLTYENSQIHPAHRQMQAREDRTAERGKARVC